jgi:hypothetical protein
LILRMISSEKPAPFRDHAPSASSANANDDVKTRPRTFLGQMAARHRDEAARCATGGDCGRSFRVSPAAQYSGGI